MEMVMAQLHGPLVLFAFSLLITVLNSFTTRIIGELRRIHSRTNKIYSKWKGKKRRNLNQTKPKFKSMQPIHFFRSWDDRISCVCVYYLNSIVVFRAVSLFNVENKNWNFPFSSSHPLELNHLNGCEHFVHFALHGRLRQLRFEHDDISIVKLSMNLILFFLLLLFSLCLHLARLKRLLLCLVR